jgi:eukaryotic-like serine/threonine-protein kinase
MAESTTLDAHRLGRFELRRVLGKGAQATVWLAHDPRLDREVAVKLMHPSAASDADAVASWLHEARSVSRLTHPNIVPVFEAEMHREQPYLVFEYVPGSTLSDLLRQRGAMAPRDGVQMMLGVLDALQAAHDAGVVHRDLKPSNILVGENGRARVMDFGIAARVQDAGAVQQIVGTPGYMSPEAARGLAPAVAMDVFSAGMVLVEVLSGRRLLADKDPYRAMHRVIHEDMKLPSDLPAAVDDALRALASRAIERDAGRRWPRICELRDALQQWLAPSASTADAGASGQSGTLEFLLRRMRHKSDFPALSDSLARIQRVANSENESVGSLSNEILKDVALTNKLLRMVNTAHYSHAGGGTISTVSRAVNLVGFAGIRNMAMSLVLLDHMHNKGHAKQLKEEFLRALMAGSLADELCKVGREGEEAFIGAMFQNLGRLLTEFYLPEEASQVRDMLVATRSGSSPEATGEASASARVLGLSFEDLGLGVAGAWGLPESLRRCMQSPSGEPPNKLAEKSQDRVRWLARAANEMTDAMLQLEPEAAASRIDAIAQRYGRALGQEARDFSAAALAARGRLSDMAKAMNLQVDSDSPARRLLSLPKPPPLPEDSLVPHALQATIVTSPSAPAAPEINAAEVLAAGVQDITNSMVENFRLNEVLRMILETMLRALEFRRVLFCLRDPKTDSMTGRFGLGDDAQALCAGFKVSLKANGDLFAAVCNKGADTLISDATAGSIAARLPAWYRGGINAPAFLLLPLQMKGAPFGLIYADKGSPGAITLGEKELSLLRTLRNQAVMAFKQSS